MNKTKHIHFRRFELKTNFPAKLYNYFTQKSFLKNNFGIIILIKIKGLLDNKKAKKNILAFTIFYTESFTPS